MRRRILLLVVGMTTLVVIAFAVPVGFLLHSAVAQRAERAATDQADNVALFLRSSPTTDTITTYVKELTSSTGRPTAVSLSDGTVIGSVPDNRALTPRPNGGFQFPSGQLPAGNSPTTGASPGGPPGGIAGQTRANLRRIDGGQLAETFVRGDTGVYAVRVYLSNGQLHAGEGAWWGLLIGGSLGLVLLAGVAGELLTRRLVRPLRQTEDVAQRLAGGETEARAATGGPHEVAAVGTALNRLADRIDELIAEERETVADLSHRLRTPLTALRLDAEALGDPEDADRIGTHVGNLERTLTAVIHAARRPQREGRLPSADAAAVARDRVAFWSALAEEQERAVDVDIPATPVPVRAAAEDLSAALDALLENVFAHTPDGTPFSVRVTADATGARIQVDDAGPGIAAELPTRGRSDRGSTGLGLDIARRTAEITGGGLRIGSSTAGGASVSLLLGTAGP